MMDTKFIGHAFDPHSADVERGQLRLFAKAVGETNPVYFDVAAARAQGLRDLPAPPTFAFSLNLLKPDPFAYLDILGVDLNHILHGEQSFAYKAPIFAGDTITITATITDIYTKKGGALEFLVQSFSARNQDNEEVVTMKSITVVRHAA